MKMKTSTDLISIFTGDQIDHINGERLRRLNIGEVNSAKLKIVKQREERLNKQNNGHFITTAFKIKTTRDWPWTKR